MACQLPRPQSNGAPLGAPWPGCERPGKPTRNPAEITRALTDAWNAVDNQTLRRLVFSMRRRCRAVIAANGGYTSY